VSQASVVSSSTATRLYLGARFVCSWHMGRWGVAWVDLGGELDLASSPQLRRTLREAQSSARLTVLDLRRLLFIDSAGIHVILDAAREARRGGGRVVLTRGPAQVERVLKLTGAAKQIVILDLTSTELGHGRGGGGARSRRRLPIRAASVPVP